MKKLLLASVAMTALCLTACGEKQEDHQADQQGSQGADKKVEKQAMSKGKPELGSFGVDLAAMDKSVKPGDDFFMYAGGTWYKNYEMPADKTRYGAFNKLADRSNDRVKAIIDDLANSAETLTGEAKMVADFYNAFMDVDTINAKGLTPLQPTLDKIKALATKSDLVKAFGQSWKDNTASPITYFMWTDRKDPDVYQMTVGAGGTSLPRDYYLVDSERFKKIRTAYVDHVAEMLTLAGDDNAADNAKKVMALETKIATYLWPREKNRNRDLTYNPTTRDALGSDYAGFDWDSFIAQTGYKVPGKLNVSTPEPVKAAIQLIKDTDMETWKAYLTYNALSNNADNLSDDVYNANFKFYGTVLRGQQEPRPRWKRAVSAMSGTSSLGFAVSKVYVDRYFPEDHKQQMSELVENLRTALGERIVNLDWMGEETKKNALAKLKAFRPKIGYPDVWQDFAGLEIKDNDLFGNMARIDQFFRDQSAADEMKKTDRERWGMVPHRVNAYYNASFNEIVFPAAILQAPFFDPNADAAVNYGGIGAVIGHEMGHGFDDQGSKSDANGIQRNWWTDEDRKAFDAKGAKLAAQYSKYEPIKDNFVNGKNSLGENIGDVGGLAMAYHAYKLSLNGQEAPVIDGLTGDQRFFLAWAQVWREKRTEQSMLSQLRGGTHAPGRYRALAPRNHDAWYKAFNVQPGDKLYLKPEDRVRIW